MIGKPKTREELRALYPELRYCASGYIMHDCFPIKNVAEMDGLLRRMHELCTPAMVLCLLDDAGLAVTKVTNGRFTLTAKKAVANIGKPKTRRTKVKEVQRTWWCEGCKKFVSGDHACA